MQVKSQSFRDGGPIPGEFCFAVMDRVNHVALCRNLNPQLSWMDVPEGTKSFAIVCHDPDVPSKGDDVNKEDREVPADLPRVNFYHWLLWGIPAGTREIEPGSQSDGVTPRGKSGPDAPEGFKHGINSYTGWFANDEQMKGDYYGYDGPCPPWNDSIVHHYVFTVYALDSEDLNVKGKPTAENVLAAIKGHVLDEGKITGLYSLNPDVRV